MALHNINFKGNKLSNVELIYNTTFVNKFNSNLNSIQKFLDKSVGTNLQKYVSYKTGTQEQSIVNANTYGKGYVTINVPYAEVQAYSKRIHKRVGLRGTRPFERMCADKKDTILNEVNEYARRLDG
jgi:hypothetical protein